MQLGLVVLATFSVLVLVVGTVIRAWVRAGENDPD